MLEATKYWSVLKVDRILEIVNILNCSFNYSSFSCYNSGGVAHFASYFSVVHALICT